MNEKTTRLQKPTAVQTTGHAWDGDLQEFNNPLPRWWLWSFYATVVFSLIYWVFYPSWPVGNGWLPGLSSITYTVDGKEETSNWNTRALLLRELDESHSAVRQREFLQKIAAADFATIRSDPEMLAFTRSVGKGLFGDNCAACHGRGGQGLVGLYPNLADDDWLWGGEMEKIQETLVQGRQGFMPAFRETFKLKPEQLDDVATYVLSLSGEAPTGAAVDRGRELFQGTGGGCYYCHGKDGKGVPSQGGANLTDKIWTVANVPAQASLDSRKAVVKEVISNGINRQMPGWEQRLTPAQIKLLSVYVHELGGGQ